MPEGLKPLMAHRCHALGWDVTQQGVRDRGACLQNNAVAVHSHALQPFLLFAPRAWRSGLCFANTACLVLIAKLETV